MAHSKPHISVPLPGPTPLAEKLTAPFQQFAKMEAASGLLLLGCAAAAMVIGNSPWGHGYHDLLMTNFTLGFGSWSLSLSLEAWINDALMAAFFFLVGMEIKREVLIGELSNPKRAAVPVIAAMGGMLAPGLIFAAFNWGEPTIRGWGVPTATDIAFSLGVLALLGKRVPAGLRIFLATLAIADDLGALVVIALFYTEKLQLNYLVNAGVCLGVMFAMSFAGARRAWAYAVVGLFLWYFVLLSGVHPTIAGVLGALAIPVKTRVNGKTFVDFTRGATMLFEKEENTSGNGRGIITNGTQQAAVQAIEDACNKVQTPLHQLEHAMAPWIAFLIIPIFALANAAVELSGNIVHALTRHETLGVILGLVVGKPIGITLASFIAVKSGLGVLPAGVNWKHMIGMSFLAGIGFTMSLFIAHLAFKGPEGAEFLNDTKLGIIVGSVLASAIGAAILLSGKKSADSSHA